MSGVEGSDGVSRVPGSGDWRMIARERLSRRALELFRERGYDNVTVDDIVAAEDVSRSSFFRSFHTKDDAVLSRLDDFGDLWAHRYRELLAEDPPWLALPRCALSSVGSYADDPQLLDLMVLLWETPQLRRGLAEKMEEWRKVFEVMTAEYLGLSDSDLLPSLITHSVIGAAEAATALWLSMRGQRDLVDLLDEALAFARQGLDSLQAPPPTP